MLPVNAQALGSDPNVDECAQNVEELMDLMEETFLMDNGRTCEQKLLLLDLIEVKQSFVESNCRGRISVMGEAIMNIDYDQFGCSMTCAKLIQQYDREVVKPWQRTDYVNAEIIEQLERYRKNPDLDLPDNLDILDEYLTFCSEREEQVDESIKQLDGIVKCWEDQGLNPHEAIVTELESDKMQRILIKNICYRVQKQFDRLAKP
jgi:hypothetical protein